MIYTNQNAVKIRMTGLGNITDASEALIKYKKPDGTEGEWTATVEDAATGIIFYNLTLSEFLIEGTYTFWAKIIYSDGRVSIGDAVTQRVYKEGEVVQ